jgi:serine protease AprX
VLLAVALLVALTGTTAAATGIRLRPAATPAAPVEAASVEVKRGIQQLAAVPAEATKRLFGIATFDGSGPLGAPVVDALEGLGLEVQPMRKLPLAVVAGTKGQLLSAVDAGVARDVYPDIELEMYSTDSTQATGALAVHDLGFTGKGVGIAIVDSGVDAEHPALADHVTHNVRLIGPAELEVLYSPLPPEVPKGALVIPVDRLPYNNSEGVSGHGTHVAGIAAADGTGNPDLVGMAPDADVIGFGAGHTLFITEAVDALDQALAHHEDWNIDVVNNSWGNSFNVFDPDDPVNVATKALHEAGVTVVFSAGNDSDSGTINPYSVAPWVISIAAASNAKKRADFTSGGLPFDNSTAVRLPGDKHVSFEGDRLGIYHPDVGGPGVDVVSTGTLLGSIVTPTTPGGVATASGTSMSSPHVAGLVALLRQARPDLTPDQIREVLSVTAVPFTDDTEFSHQGFGFVDAPAAIAYVRSANFDPAALSAQMAAEEEAVLAGREWSVTRSDLWAFNVALPIGALGLETHTFDVHVPPTTRGLSLSLTYPGGPGAVVGLGIFEWSLVVRDHLGEVVGIGELSASASRTSAFIDLRTPRTVDQGPVTFGNWTVEVIGDISGGDPTFLSGRSMALAVAQLLPQVPREGGTATPAATFTAGPAVESFFVGTEAGPLPTPEGCSLDSGITPLGGMSATKPTGACHAGIVGYGVNYGAGIPAVFEGPPLRTATTFGGAGRLRVYLADLLHPVWSNAFASDLSFAIDAVAPDGTALALTSGQQTAAIGLDPTRGDYLFTVAPVTVPAGSRLRVTILVSGVYTSTARLVYGGGVAADSSLLLTTGTLG